MIDDKLIISVKEANILSQIASSGKLPNLAIEMIAVNKGLVEKEGDIPKKIEFENFIKDHIWKDLLNKDARWQRNFSKISVKFSTLRINLMLDLDFVLFDDFKKNITVKICEFSSSKEKVVKHNYNNVSFVIRNILKEYWKGYNVNIVVIQYLSEDDYIDKHWSFNDFKIHKIILPNYHRKFDISLALELLDNSVESLTMYPNNPLSYGELPLEARRIIDELKNIKQSVLLSMNYFKQVDADWKWNKRRISEYLKNNESLALIPSDILQLYNDISRWYKLLFH